MSASATMRPSRPSEGIAPIQRTGQGSRPMKPARKVTSAAAPIVFAYGEVMGRERSQLSEYIARNAGSRKAATPKSCSVRSATNAPTTPIQLCADLPPVGLAAVLSDGSSGEYETSARTRRTAKTKSRKPISSLSRRLPVGVNGRTENMLALGRWAERLRVIVQFAASRQKSPTRRCRQRTAAPRGRCGFADYRAETPETYDYPKKATRCAGGMEEPGVAKLVRRKAVVSCRLSVVRGAPRPSQRNARTGHASSKVVRALLAHPP